MNAGRSQIDGSLDIETIIFDQYSRYRSCAEVLEAAGAGGNPGAGASVLDVGSGPERLLGRFLPGREMTYLDPLLGNLGEERRGGDRIITEPFLDHDFGGEQFDFAVAVDTLEHIPPGDREQFIERMNEVARVGVVIACPCGDVGAALDTDNQVNAVYRRATSRDYPWLKEHLEYGLPNHGDIVHQFKRLGHQVQTVGNGHGPWLRELLPLVLCLMDHPEAGGVIDALSRRFNGALFPYDHFGPCYRQIILGMRSEVVSLPEWKEPGAGEREKANMAWEEFRQVIISEVTGLIGGLSSRVAPFDLIHRHLQDLTNALNSQLSAGQEAVLEVEQRAAKLAAEKAGLAVSIEKSEEAKRSVEEHLVAERERAITLEVEKAKLTVSIGQSEEARREMEEKVDLEKKWTGVLEEEKTQLAELLRNTQEAKSRLEEHLAGERERVIALEGEKSELAESFRKFEEAKRQVEEHLATERERTISLEEEKAKLSGSFRKFEETKQRVEEHLVVERERAIALEGEKTELTDSLQKSEGARLRLEEKLGMELTRVGVLEGEKAELTDKLHRHHEGGRFLQRKLAELEGSRSWRWTKSLRWLSGAARDLQDGTRRRLGRVVRGFGMFVYHHFPMPSGVRWWFTVAYCECFRRYLRHTSTWDNYQRERQWRARGKGMANASIAIPEMGELPGGEGRDQVSSGSSLPTVIVWGVIDWHFRIQRPQHLAREMAKRGHRVVYVSPHFVDDAEPGFAAERIEGEGDIRVVRLQARGRLVIYEGAFGESALEQLRKSVGEMLLWIGETEVVSIVDHPTWHALARMIPNGRVVYDCMDNHHGFAESGDGLAKMERELVRESDLVVTSSHWLEQMAKEHTDRVVLIRNGCEFAHFNRTPNEVFSDAGGRRIIGYIGAMAEWFDADLVRQVAERFPECLILLIGADTAGVESVLSGCPNVQFTGEIPYGELPYYQHAMDVCLIPFVINGLTEATNPVKVYEYLAAGKSVVTTDLPELREEELDGLVYRADSHDKFLEYVGAALDESAGDPIRDRRREFAEGQTWGHRGEELDRAMEEGMVDPLVSIVIVTHNNLELTKHCLESIRDDGYPNREIIVVDNASTDGTPEWLREQEQEQVNQNFRVILNEDNRGFGAANNQGLAAGGGEYFVLLNNDTVVTGGWLRTLVNHLGRDRSIGIIGPVTNNIGNEARIQTAYENIEAMPGEAFGYTRRHLGRVFDIEVLAFFCVMFPRRVYEEIGPLDEEFGLGFFEDDDYCRRVRETGRRVVCAEDAFIHHELSASFGLISNGERKRLFEKNRVYYESKWGAWTPHQYREAEETVCS